MQTKVCVSHERKEDFVRMWPSVGWNCGLSGYGLEPKGRVWDTAWPTRYHPLTGGRKKSTRFKVIAGSSRKSRLARWWGKTTPTRHLSKNYRFVLYAIQQPVSVNGDMWEGAGGDVRKPWQRVDSTNTHLLSPRKYALWFMMVIFNITKKMLWLRSRSRHWSMYVANNFERDTYAPIVHCWLPAKCVL